MTTLATAEFVLADFGGHWPGDKPLRVVFADPPTACEALTAPAAGAIVLVER
jgi:hypothetical protein